MIFPMILMKNIQANLWKIVEWDWRLVAIHVFWSGNTLTVNFDAASLQNNCIQQKRMQYFVKWTAFSAVWPIYRPKSNLIEYYTNRHECSNNSSNNNNTMGTAMGPVITHGYNRVKNNLNVTFVTRLLHSGEIKEHTFEQCMKSWNLFNVHIVDWQLIENSTF